MEHSNSHPPTALSLAMVLLSPVLLMQGLYVRTVTPRLPEASGERSGLSGTGPELRLLVAGDSAAAGVGVATQEEALAGRLVTHLSAHHRIRWDLIAETGHTAGDLVRVLAEMPERTYDVALLSIGVNDATGLTGRRRWQRNLDALIRLLQTRFGIRHTLVSAIPPMHLFPALPQPLRWAMGARARWLNDLTAEVCARHPSAVLLVTRFEPRHDAMAMDGFHPGAPVYRAWAKEAANAILGRNR